MATTQPCEGLILERRGAALIITLDRPDQKNALTTSMIAGITEAVDGASADDATRVVALRSNGTDFCSGVDLVQSNRRSDQAATEAARPRTGHLQRGFQQGAHRMVLSLEAAQVPVVSAVRGWAAGIGNALALSADVVIVSTTAKFWVPFVGRGFTPDSGNTWLLPRLVGVRRAKEMILRSKPIPGVLAADWGLVSECVADDQLDSALDEAMAELASTATVAYGLARVLMHRNLELSLPAALQSEAVHEELAVRSDDFKEGMRAFAGKRDPGFTGW